MSILMKLIKTEAINFVNTIITQMINVFQYKWTPSFGMDLTLLFKYHNMELKEEILELSMDKVSKYGKPT